VADTTRKTLIIALFTSFLTFTRAATAAKGDGRSSSRGRILLLVNNISRKTKRVCSKFTRKGGYQRAIKTGKEYLLIGQKKQRN
jgi:hypothetical protein